MNESKNNSSNNLLTAVTIDGPTTQDRDDAIHFQKQEDGTATLTVFVTDPSEFRLTALEESRALLAGESTYRATATRHMLPRRVAEDNCSLGKRTVPYPTIAVQLSYPVGGDITTSVFLANVSIERVMTFAECAASEPYEGLTAWAIERLSQRRRAGALAIYDATKGWGIDADGRIRRLKIDESNLGYVVIQESMIAANAALAAYCVEHKIPILFRTHDYRADADEVNGIASLVESLFEDAADPSALNRFAHLFDKARYSAVAGRHLGLQLAVYTHGTSPLRRYADLFNLRQIKAALSAKRLPYRSDAVESAAAYLNLRRDLNDQKSSEGAKVKEGQRLVKAAEVLHATPEQNADEVSEWDTKAFYRLLRTLADARETPSDTVVSSVIQRITKGLLAPKEAACILFCFVPKAKPWPLLATHVLLWMRSQKSLAVSVLQVAAQSDWTEQAAVEYSDRRGPAHAPSFECQVSVTELGIGKATAADKQSAANAAHFDLLERWITNERGRNDH